MMLTRRALLDAATGSVVGTLLIGRPAHAADDLPAAVKAVTNGAPLQRGRVKLDIAPLVENGNTVPITVHVTSPMTPSDHVLAITVLNEKNPQRDVITCRLGPRAGRADVSTRIRLATSQQLVAIAQMSDGSFWSDSADVIVTLAACVETP
ncbi:MAG TPA: SoxY-related AACIE arm protein [Burkholderiaceae bacterium]|nr:SoxY-related AACIE arm protein [Burkholderiaceae bacterium]